MDPVTYTTFTGVIVESAEEWAGALIGDVLVGAIVLAAGIFIFRQSWHIVRSLMGRDGVGRWDD